MPIRVATLPYATDGGFGTRARIGLVAAATDDVVEHDFREVTRQLDGVELYTARYSGATIGPYADARAALDALEPTARLLLPGEHIDTIALACGTTTLTVGEDGIESMFLRLRPDAHVVTPASAIRAAIGVLGMRHIGVLTPYRSGANGQIERALIRAGITIDVLGSFDEERDSIVGKITESSIMQNVLTLADSAPIDGFVVLGSQLRALRIIATLERELGLPVVGSGQALVWHALRSAGIDDRLNGLGLLFKLPS